MIFLIFIYFYSILAGVTIELHKKQLHISLAYQFSADKKERLEALAKTINLDAPARWDLRLYSRDRAMDQYQVYLHCTLIILIILLDLGSISKSVLYLIRLITKYTNAEDFPHYKLIKYKLFCIEKMKFERKCRS